MRILKQPISLVIREKTIKIQVLTLNKATQINKINHCSRKQPHAVREAQSLIKFKLQTFYCSISRQNPVLRIVS